jgi:hypothetical protein
MWLDLAKAICRTVGDPPFVLAVYKIGRTTFSADQVTSTVSFCANSCSIVGYATAKLAPLSVCPNVLLCLSSVQHLRCGAVMCTAGNCVFGRSIVNSCGTVLGLYCKGVGSPIE